MTETLQRSLDGNNNELVTGPGWEPSDNLSKLVVVPLEETRHKLIEENYLQFNTEEFLIPLEGVTLHAK